MIYTCSILIHSSSGPVRRIPYQQAVERQISVAATILKKEMFDNAFNNIKCLVRQKNGKTPEW